MANFLKDKKFDIQVRGDCYSACANYLFIMADNKNISEGVVGFHGNAMAALDDLQKSINYFKQTGAKNIDIAKSGIISGNSKQMVDEISKVHTY